MLLLLLILVEIVALLFYLQHAHYFFYAFLMLVYAVFWFYSGAEETGNDSKPGVRNWSFWRRFTAVEYVFANEEEFSTHASTHGRRLLFMVMPNQTNMALISGFGLHGGVFDAVDVRYMMPSVLLRVPLLREALLWSGAVSTRGNRDVEGGIMQLLRKGKSVAFCPNGMKSFFNANNADKLEDLSPSLFEFARQNHVHIVPVLIEGESARYRIVRGGRMMNWLNTMSYRYLQYPLCLLFSPAVFGQEPPPKMTVYVGMPMNPGAQTDTESFRRLFMGQINGFVA
jgi:hypothetical protein